MLRQLPRRKAKEDDLTFLAGWMYADLFLAMMVVFLATVSFVPQYLGNSGQSNSTTYSYSEMYRIPMIVEYEGFDGERIAADIAAFKVENKLSQDAVIVYAQVVGSYNKSSETASDAIARAQAFITKIDATNDKILGNASTTLSSTTSIPITRVVVKFTFASNIGVSDLGK